jgi:hypothetical protein
LFWGFYFTTVSGSEEPDLLNVENFESLIPLYTMLKMDDSIYFSKLDNLEISMNLKLAWKQSAVLRDILFRINSNVKHLKLVTSTEYRSIKRSTCMYSILCQSKDLEGKLENVKELDLADDYITSCILEKVLLPCFISSNRFVNLKCLKLCKMHITKEVGLKCSDILQKRGIYIDWDTECECDWFDSSITIQEEKIDNNCEYCFETVTSKRDVCGCPIDVHGNYVKHCGCFKCEECGDEFEFDSEYDDIIHHSKSRYCTYCWENVVEDRYKCPRCDEIDQDQIVECKYCEECFCTNCLDVFDHDCEKQQKCSLCRDNEDQNILCRYSQHWLCTQCHLNIYGHDYKKLKKKKK